MEDATIMNTQTRPDPIDLLQRLTVHELSERIDRLEAERSSLSILLRAARARERRESRSQDASRHPVGGQR